MLYFMMYTNHTYIIIVQLLQHEYLYVLYDVRAKMRTCYTHIDACTQAVYKYVCQCANSMITCTICFL